MEIKDENICLEHINEILNDYPELKRSPQEYTFFVKAKGINKELIDYSDFVKNTKSRLSESENLSVYFHYPFCRNKCAFCHYFKYPHERGKLNQEIMDLLIKEVNVFAHIYNKEIKPVSSLYIGGGTPSLLELSEIEKFFSKITEIFNISQDAEATIEASIDGITKEKLELYKKYFNRVSIGIQTFNKDILNAYNRFSDIDVIIDKIKLLSLFSQNLIVNFDLIYGFPGQTISSIDDDIDTILKYFPNIQSFTFYRLRLKAHDQKSLLYKSYFNEKNMFPLQKNVLSQKYFISKKMKKLGFKEKPIGWFSRSGEPKTYIDRWLKRIPLIGFGLSSYSLIKEYQKINFSNLNKYRKAIEHKNMPLDFAIRKYNINNLETAYRLKFDGMALSRFDSSLFKEKIIKDKRIFREEYSDYSLTETGKLFVEEIIDSYLGRRDKIGD